MKTVEPREQRSERDDEKKNGSLADRNGFSIFFPSILSAMGRGLWKRLLCSRSQKYACKISAFFYASYDPAGFVPVDKPPVS